MIELLMRDPSSRSSPGCACCEVFSDEGVPDKVTSLVRLLHVVVHVMQGSVARVSRTTVRRSRTLAEYFNVYSVIYMSGEQHLETAEGRGGLGGLPR